MLRIDFYFLLDYQGKPVFQRVFRSTSEVTDHFGPLFLTVILFYQIQQMQILFLRPWPLFQVWVQVAIPMLSALLCATINFIRGIVEKIKFLRNKTPVFFPIFPSIRTSLLDHFLKQVRFSLTPPI